MKRRAAFGMTGKAKATAAAWLLGWLLLGLTVCALTSWWLAPAWVGLGLLASCGLLPLWKIVRDGLGYNPPSDWFSGKVE